MLNKRIFALTSALGVGLVAALGTLVFATQQAFPFYLGNAGTFMIKAERMDVEGYEMRLAIDSNSSSSGSQLPTGELLTGKTTVTGMILEKAFDVTSVIGNTPEPTWKIRMAAGAPVELNGATIRIVGLCASTFEATGLEVDAAGANTPDFTDDFTLQADTVAATNPGLEAAYMATNSLAISGLTLTVEPGGYDKAACLP